MAKHKRLQITQGTIIPSSIQASSTPMLPTGSQSDKPEHFNHSPRRMMRSIIREESSRKKWIKRLLMLLILLVAAYLIYIILKKGSNQPGIISASTKSSQGSKVFYF